MAEQINYAAIAKKHGGEQASASAAPTSSTGVDYASLAAKHGGTAISGPVIPSENHMEAAPGGAEGWFEDLKGDIKHGTTNTLPGKVLHGLGAEGIEKGHGGGEGGIGDIMGGEVLGPAEIGHGLIQTHPFTPGAPHLKGFNEAVKGVGHTLALTAPVAAPAILPQIVPQLAFGGVASSLASHAANAMGASPDVSELAGNVGAVAAPLIHSGMPAAGDFMQEHATGLGKAVGTGVSAYEAIKHGNPLNLLFSHPATKVATPIIRGVGKATSAVGNTPLFPHEMFETPGAPTVDSLAPEPKLLGKGPTILPPPAEEQVPMSRPAQPAITRGKGGKMQKQFLTGESSGQTQVGSNPPLIGTLGEPTTPPSVNPGSAVQDTSALADNGIEPPAKSLIQSQSLTNETKAPIVNNMEKTPQVDQIHEQPNPEDLIDTRGIQQEGRENLDQSQQAADELGRKILYKGNKPGYDPLLPGDGNENLLQWAQTPWEEILKNKALISNK